MANDGELRHYTETGKVHSGLVLFVQDDGQLVLNCPTDKATWTLPNASPYRPEAPAIDARAEVGDSRGLDVGESVISAGVDTPRAALTQPTSPVEEAVSPFVRELRDRGLV